MDGFGGTAQGRKSRGFRFAAARTLTSSSKRAPDTSLLGDIGKRDNTSALLCFTPARCSMIKSYSWSRTCHLAYWPFKSEEEEEEEVDAVPACVCFARRQGKGRWAHTYMETKKHPQERPTSPLPPHPLPPPPRPRTLPLVCSPVDRREPREEEPGMSLSYYQKKGGRGTAGLVPVKLTEK